MKTKTEYQEKVKSQLAEWHGEINQLEERARNAPADVKAEYEEQIEALKCNCKEGEDRLEQLKETAEDAWESFKDEAEEKWAALKSSMDDSMKRIKSFFA